MNSVFKHLFPLIFLIFLAKNTFSVGFGSDMRAAAGQTLSKVKDLSVKIFDKENSKKHDSSGFTQDLTDDDIQFSDYSLTSFFAGAAVLLGLALHFLYREKSLSPFTVFLLNRNVSRRYILLENLRI